MHTLYDLQLKTEGTAYKEEQMNGSKGEKARENATENARKYADSPAGGLAKQKQKSTK